ncbi:unnamed protein product [Amoebophrya sp. A25]|nr:unnamed protein product [Amoebophrya sp. A25]|eukprot:GSA25T00026419001.1
MFPRRYTILWFAMGGVGVCECKSCSHFVLITEASICYFLLFARTRSCIYNATTPEDHVQQYSKRIPIGTSTGVYTSINRRCVIVVWSITSPLVLSMHLL